MKIKIALIFIITLIFGIINPVLAATKLADADADGLEDSWEIKFKTDVNNPDTDNDGYPDGLEVKNGYDPIKADKAQLKKKIEVDLKKQKLKYSLGEVNLGEFLVSTGKKSTPTPKGTFVIQNKSPRPFSQTYKLWMPYWLGLNAPGVGIHELPEWGKGQKEGALHLGTPASHGCIRLGVGPAKKIYEWAAIGTEVKIY